MIYRSGVDGQIGVSGRCVDVGWTVLSMDLIKLRKYCTICACRCLVVYIDTDLDPKGIQGAVPNIWREIRLQFRAN